MQKYNKLIASVIVPGIIWIADSLGLPMPEGFEMQLTAVLTAIVVWAVPNQTA